MASPCSSGRSTRIGICSTSAWSRPPTPTASGRERWASSGRHGCATHARSTGSTACHERSTEFSTIVSPRRVSLRSWFASALPMAADCGPKHMPDEFFDIPEQAGAAAEAEQPADGGGDAVELQKQRDDYYDRLLRKTAEFDNYRKRTDRERQQFVETAAADLIKELLPLVDDLERALKADAGGEATGAIRRGVELIHKQLLETLRKRGVTAVEAI